MKRNTWQRDAVRYALRKSDSFVSAQALHTELKDAGSPIGLATVYRALNDLSAQGDVDSLQSPEGENLYRACVTEDHHHHLVCRNCGRTVEIAADPVENWAKAEATAHGFTQAQHVVDIFGLCAECTALAAASAGAGAGMSVATGPAHDHDHAESAATPSTESTQGGTA